MTNSTVAVAELTKAVTKVWDTMGGGTIVASVSQLEEIVDMTTQRFPMYGVAGHVDTWVDLQEKHGTEEATKLITDSLLVNGFSVSPSTLLN